MVIRAERIEEDIELNEGEELFFNRLIKNNKDKKSFFIERYQTGNKNYYSSSLQISHDKLEYHTEKIFELYSKLIPISEKTLTIYVNTKKKQIFIE